MRILILTSLAVILLVSSWITFYFKSIANMNLAKDSWLLLRPAVSSSGKDLIQIHANNLADSSSPSEPQAELTQASLATSENAATAQLASANRVVTSDGTVVFVHECRQIDNQRFRPQLISLRFQHSNQNPKDSVCISNGWWHNSALEKENQQAISPQLAADPGSKLHPAHVYCVWSDGNSIHRQKIFFSVSQDHGATWSQPSILNDIPEKNDRAQVSAAYPSVAVNHQGVVAVSWLEYNDEGEEPDSAKLKLRASIDGGNSWLESVQVGETKTIDSTTPDHDLKITTSPDGKFHPIWTNSGDNTNQPHTASIQVKARI